MGREEGSKAKSRRNARISLSVIRALTQKRKKLIFFVMEKSYSIGKASSRLKIKLSTAKMIVKRYTTDGSFFEPKPRPLRKHTIPASPPARPQHPQEEQIEGQRVKAEAEGGEAAVKVEQREEREERQQPTVANSAEVPVLPTMSSWGFLVGEYPFYFDGYMIRPCPAAMQPLFLS